MQALLVPIGLAVAVALVLAWVVGPLRHVRQPQAQPLGGTIESLTNLSPREVADGPVVEESPARNRPDGAIAGGDDAAVAAETSSNPDVADSLAGFNQDDSAKPATVSGLTEDDRVNLERNLRWMLARERAVAERKAGSKVPARPAKVGVYADVGVWHVGARSIVDALESAGVPCRVIDRSFLTGEKLKQLDAVVIPGGWAPFQRDGAGERGLGQLRAFVEGGGRCLGSCAGANLMSREVRWEGKVYPYPLGLFDGSAEGPVEALGGWPNPVGVQVTLTDQGRRRALGPAEGTTFLYWGGPRFVGGSRVEVLARFADGSSAIIARPFGKGEVILLGVHVERPAPNVGGDDAVSPAAAGELLKALLLPKR